MGIAVQFVMGRNARTKKMRLKGTQFIGCIRYADPSLFSLNRDIPRTCGILGANGKGKKAGIGQRSHSRCINSVEAQIRRVVYGFRRTKETDDEVQILCEAIASRKNILVVGGTGTGKTTFVNAIINEMKTLTPKHRLLILEDTLELQCSMENFVSMRTSSDKSMQDLLKITMRQRPDRIIIGEVRGKEALDMLKAWNTGHPGGVCTVHANDARAGLLRIEQLISEVSQSSMRELIAEAIDVIAFLVRDLTSARNFRNWSLLTAFMTDNTSF